MKSMESEKAKHEGRGEQICNQPGTVGASTLPHVQGFDQQRGHQNHDTRVCEFMANAEAIGVTCKAHAVCHKIICDGRAEGSQHC